MRIGFQQFECLGVLPGGVWMTLEKLRGAAVVLLGKDKLPRHSGGQLGEALDMLLNRFFDKPAGVQIRLRFGERSFEFALAQVCTRLPRTGKEFAYHRQVAQALNAKFYFARPYASWERGTNENTNGLLCRYRGHAGYYQCEDVSAASHARYSCKGKDLYYSKVDGDKGCYSCPDGYKRASLTRKMSDDKACEKHQKGPNAYAPATRVADVVDSCGDGRFKHDGYCKSCPAKTKRKHFIGIDHGKCEVEKEYR